jgi:hypothetical protein
MDEALSGTWQTVFAIAALPFPSRASGDRGRRRSGSGNFGRTDDGSFMSPFHDAEHGKFDLSRWLLERKGRGPARADHHERARGRGAIGKASMSLARSQRRPDARPRRRRVLSRSRHPALIAPQLSQSLRCRPESP